jgi:hypothetical protein
MSRTLRPRSGIDYSSEGRDGSVFTVESASRWRAETSRYMGIRVNDVVDMFPRGLDLPDEAESLIMPEWTDGEWLRSIDIKTLHCGNKTKTLINKIRRGYLLEDDSITEVIVDGFMNSLLHILCFDDYPCSLYPQYDYMAKIGPDSRSVKARPDFSVLSGSNKIMLVIEDKTVTSATYANNWKEDQVLGELFAAVHYVVAKSRVTTYPVTVYAVRVIGTKFTFYKADATLEYIRESARLGLSIDNEMVVQRYPPVGDDPSRLIAYDICNKDDRVCILQCLCSIRGSIC